MNKEDTAARIKVMLAYVNGKEIEFKAYDGEWESVSNPVWNWDKVEYRIKPKPSRTHEEIMTKWFKRDDNWYMVTGYNPIEKTYTLDGEDGWYRNYFDTLEMADIPPEER